MTAPISGTVTSVDVESGDIYNGGEMIEISDCTNLQISTSIDEYDISDVKKGQKVVILTDATDDDELEGEVTYVAVTTSSNSDTSMGASSSSGYEVTIKIKTKDERLLIGMTGKCSIILEEAEDVFAVPYDAIHTNANGESVIYVQDSSAGNTTEGEPGQRRDGLAATSQREIVVTKGMETDYYVEISGDDLEEGMLVIIPSDTIKTTDDSNDDTSSNLFDFMPSGGGGGMDGSGGRPSDGGRMPGNSDGMPSGGR